VRVAVAFVEVLDALKVPDDVGTVKRRVVVPTAVDEGMKLNRGGERENVLRFRGHTESRSFLEASPRAP
jgi:hypothetical protein